MKIGFIGLGIMGRPMAKNLIKAGHELVVCDFNKDHVADLVSCGAKSAANGAEMAKEVDVIITMVQNSPQVRAAVLGENGVAETGELINIDGSCNRLANSMYAQDLVIFIIGKNKIESTFDKALWRARNIAAPLNARRQGTRTPCACGELKCHDCTSPARSCHAMAVIWQKPIPMDRMWVIVINEDIGF